MQTRAIRATLFSFYDSQPPDVRALSDSGLPPHWARVPYRELAQNGVRREEVPYGLAVRAAPFALIGHKYQGFASCRHGGPGYRRNPWNRKELSAVGC